MKKTIIIATLVTTMLFISSLTSCTTTETRINNLTVGQNPSIEVTVGNGDVTLSVGPDNEITVTARMKNPDRIDYTISQEGDRVVVEAETRTGSSADVTVTAPANTEFQLIAGNGDVDVNGVQTSGQVTSGNGSLVIKQVTGDVIGSVGNGRISLSDVEGSYVLSIGNGDIKLTSAAGSFTLNSGNGDINLIDGEGSVALSVGNGSVTFKGEFTPGSDNTISAGNGSVTIEMTGSPSLLLDLEVDSSGKIRVDLPVTVSEQSEQRLIGTVGDGEASLNVRTGVGNITVK